jgi:hypothetical protein
MYCYSLQIKMGLKKTDEALLGDLMVACTGVYALKSLE